MVGQLLEMFLLLANLLAEFCELLLLTLTDGVVLVGLLSALEGVSVIRKKIRVSFLLFRRFMFCRECMDGFGGGEK